MSIANLLNGILKSKRDIVSALSAKGVTLSVSVPLSEFGDIIRDAEIGKTGMSAFGDDVWVYIALKDSDGKSLFSNQKMTLKRNWNTDGGECLISVSTSSPSYFEYCDTSYLGFKCNIGDALKDIKISANNGYNKSGFKIYALTTNNKSGGTVDREYTPSETVSNSGNISSFTINYGSNGIVIIADSDAIEKATGDFSISFETYDTNNILEIKNSNNWTTLSEISNGESYSPTDSEKTDNKVKIHVNNINGSCTISVMNADTNELINTINSYSTEDIELTSNIKVVVTQN